MIVSPLRALGERVVQAVHQREVPLGDVHAKLKGVIAMAAETVLVGASGGRAAALGALPDASATTNEVLSYVDSLIKHELSPLTLRPRWRRPRRRRTTHPLRGENGRRKEKISAPSLLVRVEFR